MKYNLLENITNALLMEAKTPEQVLDALVATFPDQEQARNVISSIMQMDPTKKKSYTIWAVKHSNNELDSLTDAIDDGQIQELITFAQENSDFQLQTFNSIQEAFDGMIAYKGKSEYEIVYEDDDWIIYVPYTYAASRYIVHHLYSGATWCTASSTSKWFTNYTSGGDKLYIFANKEDKQIYQFSPQTYEFHDSNNAQVSEPSELVGPDVAKWCEENGLDIDSGCFPGPEDIYEGGNFGLRCINDLYSIYRLCNAEGEDINTRQIDDLFFDNRDHGYSCLFEYGATVVITRTNNRLLILNHEGEEITEIWYDDEDGDQLLIWNKNIVIGLDSGGKLHDIDLNTGEDKVRTATNGDGNYGYKSLYHEFCGEDVFLLCDGYDYSYTFYVRSSNTFYKNLFSYDFPDFDDETNIWSGEDEEGNPVAYQIQNGQVIKVENENNMTESKRNKKRIKLTESQLNDIIRQTINETIDESWYNKLACGLATAGALSGMPSCSDNDNNENYAYAQQISQDQLFDDVFRDAIDHSRLNGQIITYDQLCDNFGEPKKIVRWKGTSTSKYDPAFVRSVIHSKQGLVKIFEEDGDYFIALYR